MEAGRPGQDCKNCIHVQVGDVAARKFAVDLIQVQVSQLVLILDWDWLVIVLQNSWDLKLPIPQPVCPLLNEGAIMRDGLVAQLEVFRVV